MGAGRDGRRRLRPGSGARTPVRLVYLGGLAETRRARHAEAARLLADAVRLAPAPYPRASRWPTRCSNQATWPPQTWYSALTTSPGAPHAHYGLGRSLASQGEKDAALRELEAAVQLFPEFGAAWYAQGMVLRGLGAQTKPERRLSGPSCTALRGRQ